MTPILDPRNGDIEDDAASPKQRSLLAIAGSLLVEISLLKLLFAWAILLLLPAVLLGSTPPGQAAPLVTVPGLIGVIPPPSESGTVQTVRALWVEAADKVYPGGGTIQAGDSRGCAKKSADLYTCVGYVRADSSASSVP